MGHKARPKSTLGLSDAWRLWIARALVQGVDSQSIALALIEQGTPEPVALREVDVIESSTRELRRVAQRRDLLLRLQRELEPTGIERRKRCSKEEFYHRYYSVNRPVVLEEEIAHWSQIGTWSPSWMASHYGDVEVDINHERGKNPTHVLHPERYPKRTTLGAFVANFDDPDAGKDCYMVSRNRALEGPLRALSTSLVDLPPFLESDVQGRVSLWLGPAGTRTPLHHDTTNVFFCQIDGRKRIQLSSSRNLERLEGEIRSSFYSEDSQTEHSIELEAGQALFIPVGWWHAVEALTPSISLSFTGFVWPNRFDWYRPGDC